MMDSETETVRRRNVTSRPQESFVDPDNDLRDSLVNHVTDDSTSDEASDVSESLPDTLQHLCGLDHTTSELLHMPSRALDKAEEMARHALDRAEGMAHHARDRAEVMARHACDKAEEMKEMARQACDKAEEIAWQAWEAVHHAHLPKWLRDNDFLIQGHRPQLHTYCACFKSIFRIHTETGNIWTHLLGKPHLNISAAKISS